MKRKRGNGIYRKGKKSFALFPKLYLIIFCSFDHTSNCHVNTILICNIQGVLKENEYDPTMIKRKCSYTFSFVISNPRITWAVRTYFKLKKIKVTTTESSLVKKLVLLHHLENDNKSTI